MEIYKIRRKSDGLYSTGGTSPRFTSQGKMWRKQHLHSHLALFKEYKRIKDCDVKKIYSDCEIVKFEVKEVETEDFIKYANANNQL